MNNEKLSQAQAVLNNVRAMDHPDHLQMENVFETCLSLATKEDMLVARIDEFIDGEKRDVLCAKAENKLKYIQKVSYVDFFFANLYQRHWDIGIPFKMIPNEILNKYLNMIYELKQLNCLPVRAMNAIIVTKFEDVPTGKIDIQIMKTYTLHVVINKNDQNKINVYCTESSQSRFSKDEKSQVKKLVKTRYVNHQELNLI